jgi:transposase
MPEMISRGTGTRTDPREVEMLNVRETAARLGVHENTVRNWSNRGLLIAVRLPGSGFRRFDAREVERVLVGSRQDLPKATKWPERVLE